MFSTCLYLLHFSAISCLFCLKSYMMFMYIYFSCVAGLLSSHETDL